MFFVPPFLFPLAMFLLFGLFLFVSSSASTMSYSSVAGMYRNTVPTIHSCAPGPMFNSPMFAATKSPICKFFFCPPAGCSFPNPGKFSFELFPPPPILEPCLLGPLVGVPISISIALLLLLNFSSSPNSWFAFNSSRYRSKSSSSCTITFFSKISSANVANRIFSFDNISTCSCDSSISFLSFKIFVSLSFERPRECNPGSSKHSFTFS
mmetsp:Transcript_6976/g.21705  ORF Transcript_6976/g.21705 Transcript_6976/m.21705 type:complete len:209 (-) Transcript_6976:162-788(-)